jgi:DNA-binding transcriptional LysR family regulator
MPSAAEQLHITTSAVSRTIGLVEDRLGHQLFNRQGRSLVLNTLGERLLRATQQAMAGVDTGIDDLLSDPYGGPLYISALGVLSNQIVVPAMLRLQERYPEVHPILWNLRTVEANEMLARGRLDVAFYYEAVDHPELAVECLGQTSSSVYCGPGHALFDREDVGRSDLLDHPFSVPMVGDSGQVMDGWPVDVERKIGMEITLLRSNLTVCLSGKMLTVLPDVTALPHWQSGELRRLPFSGLSPIKVYAARRRAGREGGAAAELVEAVGELIVDLQARLDVPGVASASTSPKIK